MPAWIGPPRYNPARPDSVARDCLIVPVGSQASAEAPATATKMLTVSARAECESKEPRTGCLTFIELAGTGETHQPALRETAPLSRAAQSIWSR